jgi:hypothetical protein
MCYGGRRSQNYPAIAHFIFKGDRYDFKEH